MHARAPRFRHIAPAALVLAGLGVGLVVAPMFAAPPAAAQAPKGGDPTSDTGSPFNSGEQRRQMIVQLTEMNQRLGRLETKLSSPLSVKVTEMPAVTVKDAAK